MKLEISNMSLIDLQNIQDILLTEFDNFWSYTVFENELKNSNSEYFVAKHNTEIVGFAGIWKSLDTFHLTNIVTKISKRNLGIASALLEKIINVSKSESATSLTLEVNENNFNAIKLYEKYNFKKIGIRKNYYGQNKNAIIMTLFFT